MLAPDRETSTVRSLIFYDIYCPSDVTAVTAPAQDAIAYETRVFDGRLFATNEYRDKPSDVIDRTWEGLYNGQFSRTNSATESIVSTILY